MQSIYNFSYADIYKNIVDTAQAIVYSHEIHTARANSMNSTFNLSSLITLNFVLNPSEQYSLYYSVIVVLVGRYRNILKRCSSLKGMEKSRLLLTGRKAIYRS